MLMFLKCVSTYGEETLAVLDQFQNYREILDNGHRKSECPSASVADPLPWTPLGAMPPDPRYRLAQSARRSVPHPKPNSWIRPL